MRLLRNGTTFELSASQAWIVSFPKQHKRNRESAVQGLKWQIWNHFTPLGAFTHVYTCMPLEWESEDRWILALTLYLIWGKHSLFSHGPSEVSWHTSWLIFLVTSFLLGGHAGIMGVSLTVSVFHVGSRDPSSWRHHDAARSLPTEPFPLGNDLYF